MKHVISLDARRLGKPLTTMDNYLLSVAVTQYLLLCLNCPVYGSYAPKVTWRYDQGEWDMHVEEGIHDSYLTLVKSHRKLAVINENGEVINGSFYNSYRLLILALDRAFRPELFFILKGIDELGKVTDVQYLTHNPYQILVELTYVNLLPHLP